MARKQKIKATVRLKDKPLKLQTVIQLSQALAKEDHLRKYLKNVSR